MAQNNDQAREVKDATDIVDIVSQYTTLQPAGKRMKGLSPFTNEKTPSFFVDPDAGVYYCFSSQKGGDVLTFVQEVEGVTFREALQQLAERAGIDLTAASGEKKPNNAPLYHILESAAAAYQKNIPDGVKKYLADRGISEQSIQEWGIGYAPDAWNTLCSARIAHLNEHVQAGVCVHNDEKQSVYDRFRNRIQFPFYDERNRVIGFSGRMYGDGEGAKYINSPESPLFNKSTFLYGLHKAKPHIRKHNVALLTEGPIDAIMVHQAGYPMTVATSGTAVTETHLRALQRLSNRLLIVLDSDDAGNRAALRVIAMAFSLGIDSKVVVLPEGKDPADSIREDVQQFKTAVKEALSATAFLTRYVAQQYGESGDDRIRGVKEAVLPVVAMSNDVLTREYAVREIASFCGLSTEAITQSLQQKQDAATSVKDQPAVARKKSVVSDQENKSNRSKRVEQLLAAVITAKTFLEAKQIDQTEEEKDMLEKVQVCVTFPPVTIEIAQVRYEEGFPDEESQVQAAREELAHTLKHLVSEIRKEKELQKIQQSGSPTDTENTAM